MKIITERKISTENSLNSYLGKKVFSKSGDHVGKVKDLVIRDYYVEGIIVKGKRYMFIDKKYFSSDEEAIILSIEPVYNHLRKRVFDSDGKNLGRVIGVERKDNSNDFTNLILKKGYFSKSFKIPYKEINVLKKNIILNTRK
ncbi:MAG: PRC-barrel domain-containing protein [Nanobdellota archaeon]